ncbi:GFA family protein [Thermomonas sp. HDW16]|uniref:GFA family protein n=1 Tax=Thermomonas sp. HDW16 TaxID=2714945 RepID=UPI00140B03DD|nr:GFA family protein [Thermomonas sp. HDW16]QIL21789.1 GFA family protein [Thermomonas sp. HDW16]
MPHQGSCHCGRVAFSVEGQVDTAIDCNCSICRRRGSLLAFFPRSAMVLQTPEADIATYTFNSHAIRHRFCANCGCAPFGEGVNPKTGEATVAVNVRCLPGIDLTALKVVPFDGASL